MAIEDVVDVVVEVASDGGPLSASPTWVDRTADVLAGSPIRATRGRQSEQADVSPGSASFTLRGVSDSATGLIGRRARVTATYSATEYPVWAGHVTDADDEWDGSLTRLLSVRAVGPLEVLSRDEMQGAFYGAMKQTQPLLWWPLDEPAGSTQARDIVGDNPVTVTQVGTGGTLDFGAGPVWDETEWVALTPVNSTNGKYLRTPLGVTTGIRSDEDFSLACVGATTSATGIAFGLDIDGPVGAFVALSGAQFNDGLVLNPSTYTDGKPHLCVLTYDASSGTVEYWFDGVSKGTDTVTVWTPDGAWQTASVGGFAGGSLADGNVAHAAAWQRMLSDDEVLALWSAAEVSLDVAASGFTRFGHVADTAGLPTGMRDTDGTSAVSMLSMPFKGTTAVAAMGVVESDEAGVLTESASGSVVLQGRDVRADHVPDVTLDARYDVLNAFRVRTGTSGLVNDATVTRDAGNTFTSVNQRSVDEHGRRTVSETSYSDADDHAEELAGWLANRNALPSPRSDQIVLDMETMHRRGLLASVLLLDVSSLVEVTQLPGGGSLLLDVEGFDDEVALGSWRRTLRVSPHFVPAQLNEGYLLDATGSRLGLVGGHGSEGFELLSDAALWLDASTGGG